MVVRGRNLLRIPLSSVSYTEKAIVFNHVPRAVLDCFVSVCFFEAEGLLEGSVSGRLSIRGLLADWGANNNLAISSSVSFSTSSGISSRAGNSSVGGVGCCGT